MSLSNPHPPVDALPVVVQGKRIGHAQKLSNGDMSVTIYNIVAEKESLRHPEKARVFVVGVEK